MEISIANSPAKMDSDCESCVHKSVCALKDDYAKYYEEIKAVKPRNNFHVSFTCDHHAIKMER